METFGRRGLWVKLILMQKSKINGDILIDCSIWFFTLITEENRQSERLTSKKYVTVRVIRNTEAENV